MSPKKSKRSQAAQQLIDDLLEDSPSTKKHSIFDNESDDEVSLHLENSQKVVLDPVAKAQKDLAATQNQTKPRIVLDGEQTPERPAPAAKPPFEGDLPVVTKLVQRPKIERPPQKEIHREEPQVEVDFGAMSAEDPYDGKASQADDGDERTMKVAPNRTLVSPPEVRSEVIPLNRQIDRGGATEIRSGVKIPPSPRVTAHNGSAPSSFEASLKQSESLRIAQNRITELEHELERVRRDNEALTTAGDTLRRRADELTGKAESFEIQARESAIRLDEEKKVLRGQIQAKDRDNSEMKARVEEIETRLESNFKKIRVRERELEHRLEIVKMESATLVSTKDKMLLDLKRQIDQLHQESDSAKSKSQEMFSQFKEKQDTIRRVVRALRIALTILEGDDETAAPPKKHD